MGSNVGFGSNGFFQNNFNQDAFSPSPFRGGIPHKQYFPQQQMQPNIMGAEDDGNGEVYLNNDLQPGVGLFNEVAFQHNQFSSPLPQFSPRPSNIPHPAPPTPSHPPQQLNSKAAELKARLLKERGQRASSTTPSITNMILHQPVATEGSNSLRGSPRTPVMAPSEDHEQDQNIQELISQYSSDSKPTTEPNTNMKQENNSTDSNGPSYQRPSAIPDLQAKSQTPSLGSPTKVSKPMSNCQLASNDPVPKSLASRHASNGSLSEASEGEIVEDSTPQQPLPSTETQKAEAVVKPVNNYGQISRRPREESSTKVPYSRGPRDESPPPRASSKAKPQFSRKRDDRQEDIETRPERRHYQSDYNERRTYSNSDKQPYLRREARDQNEEYRRTDTNIVQKREDIRPNRETKPPPIPTLTQVLPHDEDLREWLEITGYHNEPYRDKILKRRRAIAALDAQKNALLAEMEAEERGVIPGVGAVPTPSAAMLPPPAPAKAATQAGRDSLTISETLEKYEAQQDRIVSNKRPYGDFQDGRDDGATKVSRTDDHGFRKKEDDDDRCPRSSGFDSSKRPLGIRRVDRDSTRSYGADTRGRGRGGSRERDLSPEFRAHENRFPRGRGYDYGSDDYFDHEDQDGRDPRPFEVRGGYRGRAYDPNFRGRGRGGGRGRGDYQSQWELSFEPRSDGPSTSFGSRIAKGKPFMDHKGFNRGGKGDTRYFIVKSFNEDNVLKCIEDSIWTTQAQNGPIFKEAFEKCKNVILVFSINKSRAFQGYARMESLPGSIEVPGWQKAINWESAGAFKVKWLVICATRFHRIGHLKNALNDNQAVLIGKDGQEIDENCGAGLIELIDEEVDQALQNWRLPSERTGGTLWDD